MKDGNGEDGEVRVLKGRNSLYNDNFTPNDKSDDTLKTEFKDAKILVSKNTNDKDDTNDLYGDFYAKISRKI